MIGMDKIEDIRRRARGGQPVARIAREVGVSEPTVRKYRDMEGLSERPPAAAEPGFPPLEGLTAAIDSWLEDDCRNWRKQRHTATRVYVRLCATSSATGAATRRSSATSGAGARRWSASGTRGTRPATCCWGGLNLNLTQLPISKWFDLFADATYADACLARLTDRRNGYRLEMNGKSMRDLG